MTEKTGDTGDTGVTGRCLVGIVCLCFALMPLC